MIPRRAPEVKLDTPQLSSTTKPNHFGRLPFVAMIDQEISRTDKLILTYINQYSIFGQGKITASNQDIADATGYAIRTVERSMTSLTKARYIKTVCRNPRIITITVIEEGDARPFFKAKVHGETVPKLVEKPRQNQTAKAPKNRPKFTPIPKNQTAMGGGMNRHGWRNEPPWVAVPLHISKRVKDSRDHANEFACGEPKTSLEKSKGVPLAESRQISMKILKENLKKNLKLFQGSDISGESGNSDKTFNSDTKGQAMPKVDDFTSDRFDKLLSKTQERISGIQKNKAAKKSVARVKRLRRNTSSATFEELQAGVIPIKQWRESFLGVYFTGRLIAEYPMHAKSTHTVLYTAKDGAQMRRLVESFADLTLMDEEIMPDAIERTYKFLKYTMDKWDEISKVIKIQGLQPPSVGILLGYRDAIVTYMRNFGGNVVPKSNKKQRTKPKKGNRNVRDGRGVLIEPDANGKYIPKPLKRHGDALSEAGNSGSEKKGNIGW